MVFTYIIMLFTNWPVAHGMLDKFGSPRCEDKKCMQHTN